MTQTIAYYGKKIFSVCANDCYFQSKNRRHDEDAYFLVFIKIYFEYNFIKYKQIYGNGIPDDVYKRKAPSLLIGPGFASGRDADNKTFYYISVLFDVIKNKNSPYVDNLGRVNPIIRAGVNIALFQTNGGGLNSGRRTQQRRRF